MKLTDDLLVKYADGKLDSETAHQVSELLQSDEVAAERFRLISLSGQALAEERVNPLSDFPIEDHADSIVSYGENGASRKEARPRLANGSGVRIAASLALVVAGALIGVLLAPWFWPQEDAQLARYPTWIVRVVDYHTLYDRETLASSRATPEAIGDFQKKFSAVLKKPLLIPDLNREQLEFRRGQILKFEDTPIIQLAYLPVPTGRPVALCVKLASGGNTELVYYVMRGMGVVQWTQGGLEYLLVGYLPKADLLSSARSAKAQISSRRES